MLCQGRTLITSNKLMTSKQLYDVTNARRVTA